MQWLEEGERRREAGAGSEVGQRETALAEVARNGPQHNAGEDRGSDEAEDGEAEKGVGHADLRIPGESTGQRVHAQMLVAPSLRQFHRRKGAEILARVCGS